MGWTRESRNVFISDFIRVNTSESLSVVELGAGRCDKLSAVSGGVKRRIAIDLHQPTLDAAVYRDCERYCGDMQHYQVALAAARYTVCDTVMIIDSLEHLPQVAALLLLEDLQADFQKVLLIVPEGEHPQDEDVTGLGNPFQAHLSTWCKDDLTKIGFAVMVVPDFHDHGGCMFATWSAGQ
jgi:hypothetical protein